MLGDRTVPVRRQPIILAAVGHKRMRSREQTYAPGFFARLLKLELRQRKSLANAIEAGRFQMARSMKPLSRSSDLIMTLDSKNVSVRVTHLA